MILQRWVGQNTADLAQKREKLANAIFSCVKFEECEIKLGRLHTHTCTYVYA